MTGATQLASRLRAFGAPETSVIALDRNSPDSLRYVELLGGPIAGVVERDAFPHAYVIAKPLEPEALKRVQRQLAWRDDARFLAVLAPGHVELRRVSLDNPEADFPRIIRNGTPEAAMLFPSLSLASSDDSAHRVQRRMVELLQKTTAAMTKHGVDSNDALSLAGRALFLRFLFDRGIVKTEHLTQIVPDVTNPADLFSSATRAHATSRWLSKTFNGDLLPLPDKGNRAFFDTLGTGAFTELSKIAAKSEPNGQLEFEWAQVDFAHVPVGVLSEVYEEHVSRTNSPLRKSTSVYYTPRRIAEYVVREAFAALDSPASARVLDPAAGGGVFLIAAFRQLVEERARQLARRPNRDEIRAILYEQIRGFDINDSALRLSALGLYLTALELDPEPTPLEALKFDDLHERGVLTLALSDEERALVDGAAKAGQTIAVAGSLGDAIDANAHDGKYDLVVGNPPWTAISSDVPRRGLVFDEWTRTLRPVVEKHLGKQRARKFKLPDNVPDIGFLWRSLEWAKDGGHVALVIHPRFLFTRASVGSSIGEQARTELLEAARVTGLVNGAAIRLTKVWPGNDAGFCLAFLQNQEATASDAFAYANIVAEEKLNRQGEFRVDPATIQALSQRAVAADSTLLKTLFRGSALDLELLRRIEEIAPDSWTSPWPATHQGVGYKVHGKDKEGRPSYKPAGFLSNLRALTRGDDSRENILIDVSRLPAFPHEQVHRPRTKTIYESPIVLVPKSPSGRRDGVRALFAEQRIAYNESFYGYSTAWHDNPPLLARWLLVLFHSFLPEYVALLTSPQIGVEREVLLKNDLDSLPFFPLEKLTPAQQRRVTKVGDALLAKLDEKALAQVDDLVFDVYGLTELDREVVRDTLSTQRTYPDVMRNAQRPTFPEEALAFPARVEEILAPMFHHLGRRLTARLATNISPDAHWHVLKLSTTVDEKAPLAMAPPLEAIFGHGRSLSSSRVVYADAGRRTLWVAQLNQWRYWTPSQARLFATFVLDHHERVLLGGDEP